MTFYFILNLYSVIETTDSYTQNDHKRKETCWVIKWLQFINEITKFKIDNLI